MNSVLELLLSGERLDSAQMSEVLGMTEEAVKSELSRLQENHTLLGWRAILTVLLHESVALMG